MAESNQPPIISERQISLSSRSDTDPTTNFDLEGIDCTPNTKTQLMSLKRKASQLWDEGSPNTTTLFLKWRLAVIESILRVRIVERQALTEDKKFFDKTNQTKSTYIAEIDEGENALLNEKAFLLSQRKTLEEDIDDTVGSSKVQIMDAYFTELQLSLDTALTSENKLSGRKATKLDRNRFSKIVNEYLETNEEFEVGNTIGWCNVLGHWLSGCYEKCAHIVPFSWNTKEIAHTFGSDEPPLTSRRNGLRLHTKIKEAFDNCWITIVPAAAIQSTPTEWKVILLNPAISDDIFFTDFFNLTGQKLWKWRDIHNRTLNFRNENRPARRFLYLRYALAYLHADRNSWAGFKDKVPPGEIWAYPTVNSPDGYLRKSILLELGRNKLPMDFIRAGIFEDPATSSAVSDEVSAIRVTGYVKDHLDGVRDVMEREDEDESESEGEGESDADEAEEALWDR